MLALGVFLLLQSLFAVQISAAPLFVRSFIDFVRRTDTCNGNSALCARKYSDVTFIGTHDSAFVGLLPTQNQIKSITDQLNGGIRFLQSQTHNFENTLKMCHTSCDLEDAGTVENYLQEVKAWMDMHPRDVVTLLLTNPDKVPMSTFDAVFKKVGLDQFAFKPASSPNPLGMQDWPTLGDMLNAGQRLVAFIGMYFGQFRMPPTDNYQTMEQTKIQSLTSSTSSTTFSRHLTAIPILSFLNARWIGRTKWMEMESRACSLSTTCCTSSWSST